MTHHDHMRTKPGPVVEEDPVAFVHYDASRHGWVATWRTCPPRHFSQTYGTFAEARAVVPKSVQRIVKGKGYD